MRASRRRSQHSSAARRPALASGGVKRPRIAEPCCSAPRAPRHRRGAARPERAAPSASAVTGPSPSSRLRTSSTQRGIGDVARRERGSLGLERRIRQRERASSARRSAATHSVDAGVVTARRAALGAQRARTVVPLPLLPLRASSRKPSRTSASCSSSRIAHVRPRLLAHARDRRRIERARAAPPPRRP